MTVVTDLGDVYPFWFHPHTKIESNDDKKNQIKKLKTTFVGDSRYWFGERVPLLV